MNRKIYDEFKKTAKTDTNQLKELKLEKEKLLEKIWKITEQISELESEMWD